MLHIRSAELDPYLGEARGAHSLHEVGEIAARALRELHPQGAALVIGPVTNGGIIVRGSPSFEANLRALEHKIIELQRAGNTEAPVFNHLVFRFFVDKYRRQWLDKKNRNPREFFHPLLHDFYALMLGTDLVRVVYLMHGWRRSRVGKYVHRSLSGKEVKFIEV